MMTNVEVFRRYRCPGIGDLCFSRLEEESRGFVRRLWESSGLSIALSSTGSARYSFGLFLHPFGRLWSAKIPSGAMRPPLPAGNHDAILRVRPSSASLLSRSPEASARGSEVEDLA
jgi:hypothetical protein